MCQTGSWPHSFAKGPTRCMAHAARWDPDAGEVGGERALQVPEAARPCRRSQNSGPCRGVCRAAERHLGLTACSAVSGRCSVIPLTPGWRAVSATESFRPTLRFSRSSSPGRVGKRQEIRSPRSLGHPAFVRAISPGESGALFANLC
jgi:hypothetical protein